MCLRGVLSTLEPSTVGELSRRVETSDGNLFTLEPPLQGPYPLRRRFTDSRRLPVVTIFPVRQEGPPGWDSKS